MQNKAVGACIARPFFCGKDCKTRAANGCPYGSVKNGHSPKDGIMKIKNGTPYGVPFDALWITCEP